MLLGFTRAFMGIGVYIAGTVTCGLGWPTRRPSGRDTWDLQLELHFWVSWASALMQS